MATRALQQVVTYIAWNTNTNTYQTGDVGNHTLSWVKDGTRSAPTNAGAASEIDSTNIPGRYKCTMTSTETDCIEGMLDGKSSTANVVLIGTMVAFDYLNTSAPATAGIPDVNVKNYNNQAAATDSNNLPQVDVEAINGNMTAASNVSKTNQSIMRGVCSGGTTQTAVCSSITTPSSLGATNQLVGCLIKFDSNTTTVNLRSQESSITQSSTGAAPTLTYVAMTDAPVAGDTFSVL
jgi:hypothetical protein